MSLTFLIVYACIVQLLQYWGEGHQYVFSVLSISTSCDHFTLSFFLLLGVVSGCVCTWAFFYMDNEIHFQRFVSLLLTFIMSMVFLIFFSNLFMTLIGWDALGLTSFLLVIFYKNRKSLGSGMITGLTNRLGDCLLFCVLGLFMASGDVLVTLILTLLMSMTKSAQFPFSAWLPSAMAAPTPVSALVHSSTLVTAGVYVLIRYCQTDTSIMLYLGMFTMLLAGFSACAESDLKKVVALSTLSQLGVMMISIGAHEKSYCFFHLMSHAIFKALLFMCIGTCIHTVYGTQDYRGFNLLLYSMVISVLCMVANLSLFGFLFTTGFYSKEKILEMTYSVDVSSCLISGFLVGVGLTTCYSIKLLLGSFMVGSFTSTSSSSQGGSSWTIKGPLYVLGVSSVMFGSIASEYCNPMTVPLKTTEKANLLVIILLCFILGYWLARLRSPLLSSMSYIVPLSQRMADIPSYSQHQMHHDKGWIEAGSLSLSSLVTFAVTHYSPVVGMGLSSLLISLVLFYDQYF